MNERAYNREMGARIRQARKAAGLTQVELSEHCGFSRGSIANIELGDQAPPLYRLTLIAAALGVDPGELLPDLRGRSDAVAQAIAAGLPDDLVAIVRDVASSARRDAVS